jgi:hypothetical protein
MRSFVACAKITAFTIFFTFVSFQFFALAWTLALGYESRTLALYGMLWLNQITTVFIGVAAGVLAPRHEDQRPIIIAAISAMLVELLHASASGAIRSDRPLKTLAITAACAALAAGIAWLRARRASIALPEGRK